MNRKPISYIENVVLISLNMQYTWLGINLMIVFKRLLKKNFIVCLLNVSLLLILNFHFLMSFLITVVCSFDRDLFIQGRVWWLWLLINLINYLVAKHVNISLFVFITSIFSSINHYTRFSIYNASTYDRLALLIHPFVFSYERNITIFDIIALMKPLT